MLGHPVDAIAIHRQKEEWDKLQSKQKSEEKKNNSFPSMRERAA